MRIDWARKLSSRKFWLALVGLVTSLLLIFKVDNATAEKVGAIIMQGAVLISYILAEGFVDAERQKDGR